MKSLQLVIAALLISFSAGSQNLVPNPGFESNTGLPTTTGQWALANDWSNAASMNSSPDYFHNLGILGGDLPETPIGEVHAFEGDAVMGFAATGEKGLNFREYLSVKLTQALEPGRAYELSFRITNGQVSAFSNAGLSTSHMGMCVSVDAPVQVGNTPLLDEPTARFGNTIYGSTWRFVQFYFEADVAAEYLTIGVFGMDADKDIIDQTGNNPSLAYYFVDDFKMVEVDPVPIHEEVVDPREEKNEEEVEIVDVYDEYQADFYIPNAFSPDNDGINDVFFPYSKKGYSFEMKIFNKWGELVYTLDETSKGWDGSNVKRNTTSDFFVWQLIYDKVNEDSSRVEKILEGSLTIVH